MSIELPSAIAAPAILARSILKSYPTRSSPLTVLREVDLRVEAGQAAVILGPSGSGKSTLLSILGTLETPTGGERQRVALARALINHPAILLADEPTGNLDRKSADNVADLLLDLPRREQAALVVVTHSLRLAQRIESKYELVDGRLEALGGE